MPPVIKEETEIKLKGKDLVQNTSYEKEKRIFEKYKIELKVDFS